MIAHSPDAAVTASTIPRKMDAKQKAQQGFSLVKEAILECLGENPEGLGNAQVAEALDLHTDYKGSSEDYLTWAVLGVLMNEQKVRRDGRRYLLAVK